MWRVARSRLWLVALAGVLALDFLAIPHRPWAKGRAKVAVFGEPQRRGTAHGRPLMGRPRAGESGLEWVWPWEAAYEATEAEDSPWRDVSVFVDMRRRDGTYHLTQESLVLHVFPRTLPELQREELHRVLLRELREDPEVWGSDYAQSMLWVLETGGWSASRPIEAGVRADRFVAGLGAAWCVLAGAHALGWVVGRVRRRSAGSPV